MPTNTIHIRPELEPGNRPCHCCGASQDVQFLVFRRRWGPKAKGKEPASVYLRLCLACLSELSLQTSTILHAEDTDYL